LSLAAAAAPSLLPGMPPEMVFAEAAVDRLAGLARRDTTWN
jgi:hypothetical protein